MPKMEYKSAAKPSLYAYRAPLEEKKSEEKEKVATAILSIAARQKSREATDKKDDDKMEVYEDVREVLKDIKDDKTPGAASSSKKEEDKPAAKDKEEKQPVAKETKETEKKEEMKKAEREKEKEKDKDKKKDDDTKKTAPSKETPARKELEPNFEILQNPARVMCQQLKVLSIAEAQSYLPLKDVGIGGIIVMQHVGKNDQELVEPVAAYGPKNEDKKEPDAPEPFEYVED